MTEVLFYHLQNMLLENVLPPHLAALGQQRRSRGGVDGPVDAGAAEQRRVGRVDDGVDALLRDVALHRVDGRAHARLSSRG